MTPTPTIYGLVANPSKPGSRELALRLVEKLGHSAWQPRCDPATAAWLGPVGASATTSWRALGSECEVIIVLGGDGTMLRTVQLLGDTVPPLAAINLGRLGFLTTAAEEDESTFTNQLISRQWTVSHRSQLEVDFPLLDGSRRTGRAVNEVTLTRGASSRMIQVEARIDGGFINRYSGDGLIIATPTGSTAYSLSAGGPIVAPEAAVFIITPICCHALSNRALIVADTSQLELLPMTDHTGETLLSIDGGDSIPVPSHLPITLRRSATVVPLIQPPDHTFYSVLHQKLGWEGSRV
jgi:NAD+ kinase